MSPSSSCQASAAVQFEAESVGLQLDEDLGLREGRKVGWVGWRYGRTLLSQGLDDKSNVTSCHINCQQALVRVCPGLARFGEDRGLALQRCEAFLKSVQTLLLCRLELATDCMEQRHGRHAIPHAGHSELRIGISAMCGRCIP